MATKLTTFLLFLLPITSSAFAQVEVRVTLVPKEGFDSENREDFELIKNSDLLLTVINKSAVPIKIPQGYWPTKVRVCSSGSIGTSIPLVLGRRDDKRHEKTSMELEPKAEHEILRVDAATVLLSPGNQYALDPKAEFAKPRWVWNWGARLGSDYSPFEVRKGDKRTDHAVLWGELDLDGQTLRSVPIGVTNKNSGG